MSKDQRYELGCAKAEEVIGKAELERLVDMNKDSAPDVARHVIEHVWHDLFTRSGLELKTRELVTVSILSTMGDAAPQLKVHMNAALNVGATPRELSEVVTHVGVIAGVPRGMNASRILAEVFRERGVSL